MRADSKKIVVLITDGESHDDITLPLQNLTDSGIEVYIIGDLLCQLNNMKGSNTSSETTTLHHNTVTSV